MFKREIVKILKGAGIEVEESQIETPANTEFGDLSFPCFSLAKEMKKNPNLISQEFAKKIKLKKKDLFSKVEAKGAYLNFYFNWNIVSVKLLKKIFTEKGNFGRSKINSKKKALVEYSSPNPAHPIHVGSARSTFIGETVARVLEFTDYQTKRLIYINNLGRQVAVLLWGYLKFAKGSKPTKKPDHWVLDIYVKANKELEDNPSLSKEVDELLQKCESGDKNLLKELNKITKWVVDGFKETYKTLEIKFDEEIWEDSFIKDSRKIVDQLEKNKAVFKSDEGTWVVNLEPHGLPSTVILRSNGTGLYLTRDIATSLYKYKKYKPDLNIYVVAEDQSLYFKQQFKIFELLGLKEFAANSHHVGFGMVTLPEGKMSSRKGRLVTIDDLFIQTIDKVKEKFKVEQKIAEEVGIGAVIYSIIRIDPQKQVNFDMENVLSLEGDTGPYIQYAHTRAASILDKAKKFAPSFKPDSLSEQEKNLIKNLMKFPQIILQISKDFKVNTICNYTFDLATSFNSFYQACPVLSSEKNVKNFRLALVLSTKQVLTSCLYLMNMKAPEKM